MAKYQKNASLAIRPVVALRALIPLMEAFYAKSDREMKGLILETAKNIYCDNSSNVFKRDLEEIISLIKAIHPRDTLETLYAAEIVLCHILGMHKLAEPYIDDHKLGLNLLRFCHDVMQQIENKTV